MGNSKSVLEKKKKKKKVEELIQRLARGRDALQVRLYLPNITPLTAISFEYGALCKYINTHTHVHTGRHTGVQ